MTNIDIDRINSNATKAAVSSEPIYTIGMEIGYLDPIFDDDPNKDNVEWFTIVYIEPDTDMPIGWLYLMAADTNGKEVHQKVTPGGIVNYTDMIDSISDNIILP